ncbi:GGDEF domain-containing protein [Actinoplanes sp. TBRC 11911]|uniref:GGDEF domain-containing protein n=1 Tax=Actinoplanes sp. TBRC 11911 TaxID=2729386 RepID=UPI00145D071F|nr:GGDEF domain-containing protein [Actinoplanes sp. TBRC 11911]NMO57791.1 GGDEF domain-containing protein [Actinoplanes sp. TBRC 11911]
MTAIQFLAAFLLFNGHDLLAGGFVLFNVVVLADVVAIYDLRAVRLRERLAQLRVDLDVAHTDSVTGLAVRRLAERRLFEAAGSDVTVAVIDVDGMHDINATHTHAGGDAYLLSLAERLCCAAEPGDLVARLGGDEFALITQRDPVALEQSLASALAIPTTMDGVARPVRVSIGICRAPGGDPHTALGRADRAMYTAKRSGSGTEHYDPVRDGEPLPAYVRPAVRRRTTNGDDESVDRR